MRLFFISIVLFCNCLVYSQDKKNGYVKIYYPNGNISSEGLMVNGKPDGFWKTYYVNGLVKSEGKRLNHLLDSIWVFYTETGDTSEKITYLLGKKNGWYFKYKSVHDVNSIATNNIVSKELYVNDLREGFSTYYFDNGNIQTIVNYKNNRKHGESKEYDEKGNLISLIQYSHDFITVRVPLNRYQEDKQEGLWREYYPTGKIKAEKTFKEGILSGYTKEYDEQGRVINTQLFVDGKIKNLTPDDTIDIEERLTYFPDKKIKTRFYFKKGIPVGIHREYNAQGEVVQTWVYNNFGQLTGKGIISDEGVRTGKFSFFYENGEVKSEGEFVNNRQDGKWLFYFKDKKFEQIGNFSNGLLVGEWKWFHADSSILRIENFVSSKRNGLFIELSLKGDTITRGNYLDNKRTGEWYVNNGDTYEIGKYIDDLKVGEWKTFYKDGTLMYRGAYEKGIPVGKHLVFYDNGLIKEEQFYVAGMREKVWKKYNPDGTLFVSITYQSDMETRINGYKLEIFK